MVLVTVLLIRPIRTSTLSGVLVHLERQPLSITQEQQVCMRNIKLHETRRFLFLLLESVMDKPIFLGRAPMDECTSVELMCQQCDPFPSGRIITRQDTTFEVVIGPSANPRGYTAITGHH